MANATALAFWASLLLSTSGTVVALICLAYGYQRCTTSPELGVLNGIGTSCDGVLSLSWTIVAMQIVLLLGTAVCAATQRIHAFRSTLWSVGAVTVCLAAKDANTAYNLLPLLQLVGANDVYGSQTAYIVGASLFMAGNLLLAVTGDAMYRAKRIEGRDGFVTFRRAASKAGQGQQELKDDQQEQEQEEGQDAAPVASQAGPVGWLFLAALAVSVAGTFVALGGLGALQESCLANGTIGGQEFFVLPLCSRDLSLRWVVWGLQCCFLAAVGFCYKARQIHSYRASLWSLAGVVTGLSAWLVYWFVYDYATGSNAAAQQPRAAWDATLAGFSMIVLANFALIVSGDCLYRLRHEEGADGFVSMRRPGPYTKPAQPAAASARPRRPIEWAFLLSLSLALAGTIVALGALAGAQSSCSPETLTWRGRGDRCTRFFAFMWFAMALELLVLAGTAAAWARSYVHSFKASLWALAAVVTFACCVSANHAYMAWGFSTGATHNSLVTCLYGFAVVASANFLIMGTGDALHQLRREENAAGFVTFRRPNLAAMKPAASADKV